MSLLVPNTAEVLLLKYMLNHTAATNVVLKLYTSNTTPSETSVVGDFTEAAATGYADITLTGASWTVSTTLGVTTAEYAEQTFTMTATLTAYGYYVTTLDEATLLWAERFDDGPYTLPGGGGTISVTPTITLE